MLLEVRGHQVHKAASVAAATQVMEHEANNIDCLIIDFSLPGTNGLQLFNQFRSIGWNIPTILCSDFSIYSEFDLESKRLVFDEKWVGSGVTEFLTEIRKEKGDRQYLPKIDRDIIIEIVERHAWLWIMLNQESVLGEELHQLIA